MRTPPVNHRHINMLFHVTGLLMSPHVLKPPPLQRVVRLNLWVVLVLVAKMHNPVVSFATAAAVAAKISVPEREGLMYHPVSPRADYPMPMKRANADHLIKSPVGTTSRSMEELKTTNIAGEFFSDDRIVSSSKISIASSFRRGCATSTTTRVRLRGLYLVQRRTYPHC